MRTKKFRTVRGYQQTSQSKLTPTMEDYLEMIYRQCKKNGYTRTSQLAELLNVQAPSATRMIQKLAELGLLDYEKYGIIRLTARGNQMGKYLLNRHNIVEQFLLNLGVEPDSLLTETELIEHNISVNTLEIIHRFNCFMAENPQLLDAFHRYRQNSE